MRKRILSIMLTLCMVLMLLPSTLVLAADDTTELQNQLNNGGTVKLQKDYVITSTLNISKDVTLDLNGYVLKMNSQGNVIEIVKGRNTFTLNDSFPTRTHSGDFSALPAGGLIVGFSKTESKCSGVVSYYPGNLFVMNGGTIMNCSNNNGGGVQMAGGACFVMNNGTITECHAINDGGGVNVTGEVGSDSVYFTMNGGTIENCSSDRNYKGVAHDCVSLGLGAKFHANGGTVKGNIRLVKVTVDSEKQNSCTTCYGTVLPNHTVKLKAGVFYGGALNYITDVNISDFTIESLITSPYYTVSFDLDGGTGDIPTQYFVNTNTSKALKPADPTRDGYRFLGWYNGNTEYKFDKPVTENISLEAKWESFNVNSESELKNKINLGLDTVKLTSDIKLTSTLDLSDKTLTIDLNGYVLTGDVKIADSSSSNKSEVTLIDSNPTATHSDTSLPLGGVLNGNITLTRNGGSKSVLNANGGSVTGTFNLHSYASKVYNSNNNKTTTSFYGNVNVSVDNAEIYTGIYYKALSQNFKSSLKGKLLTFYVDENEYCYEVYTASTENSRVPVTVAPAQPTKSGYAFASWKYKSTSSEESFDWSFGSGEADIFPTQLNAAFSSNTYSISYELNGGTATNPTTYTVESEDITLTNPTKSGYTFTGWSGTGLAGDNNMTVTILKGSTGDRSYTAHYSVNSGYTVSYDVNGGNALADTTGVRWTDKILDVVSTPTRTGYTFKGWKHNDTDTDITADTAYKDLVVDDTVPGITLTAQWEEKSGYKVIFNTAGGTAEDTKTNVKWTDKVLAGVSNPTRDGYEFTGWKCKNATVTTDTPYADLAVSDTFMDVTLTAQWKDITAPTGEIKLGTNSWKAFLNNITFGLFFKDTQEVTITATDNSGEDVTIEYLLSDRELSETDLASKIFTAYSGKFNIEPNNEYVIYAKLTDTTGNAAYINSNGIVLDNVKPVISGVADGETYCAAQTVTVTEKYVDTVTVNGKPVTPDTNGQFTLSPAEVEQKIVVTDKAGNTTEMTVTVNDGHTGGTADCTHKAKCEICGEEYGEVDGTNHTDEKVWTTKNETQHEQTWKCCAAAIVALENHEWKDGVCEECGYVCVHTGGTADCTHKAKCEVCGEEYGEADGTNHTDEKVWTTKNETQHEQTWKCCGAAIVALENHEWKDGVCEECGYVCVHTGGTADCTHKAKCEICGEEYGEVNAENHTTLKHVESKAATTEAEGNTEYWHCEECGKYFGDKDGKTEISLADTVIAKLAKSESPKTGDNSRIALWIVLLFVSGGGFFAIIAYRRRKRYSVK